MLVAKYKKRVKLTIGVWIELREIDSCFSKQKELYFYGLKTCLTFFSILTRSLCMTKEELKELLQQYKRGKLTEREVIGKLSSLKFESLGFATVDHHRQLRQGFPEVILCQGKTPPQVAEIASRIAQHAHPLLATRATGEHFKSV